jgi:hypothetical protein
MALEPTTVGWFQQAGGGRRWGRGAGACRRGGEPVLGVGREMAHRRLATHGDSARSEGNDNDGPKKGSRKLVRWSVRSTKQVRSSRRWRWGRRMAGVAWQWWDAPCGGSGDLGALMTSCGGRQWGRSFLAVTHADEDDNFSGALGGALIGSGWWAKGGKAERRWGRGGSKWPLLLDEATTREYNGNQGETVGAARSLGSAARRFGGDSVGVRYWTRGPAWLIYSNDFPIFQIHSDVPIEKYKT